MENNNLVNFLMTTEDIDDTIEMVDSFELQDVNNVLGEDTFLTIMEITDSLPDNQYKIVLLSSLDKLLNTDRNSLVEYDDAFPTIRKNNVSELKRDTVNSVIDSYMNTNIEILYTEYPTLSNYSVVVDSVKVLNTLYLIESKNGKMEASLSEDGEDLYEYIIEKGYGVIDILNKFDDVEDLFDEDTSISNFFSDIDEGKNKTIKSFIELVINLK
ncbi:hypothetical protein [Staphylococcus phage vB_SsapH-Golestan-105-M]|nr:hypothetical protein [Staphylococcus phage vB_SsapH-Golestan-105-M]